MQSGGRVMSLTIAEYFDRLATEGLGIYVSEEFDNAIVDTLEIDY